MIRVWFNHWFSTSYGLIELMKNDKKDRIYVIASNKQPDSVIQKVCDEWYTDPMLDGDEYVEYCVNFCVEHKIDVFVPRKEMAAVSRERQRFEEAGVKVMADDYSVISMLDNKAATYDLLKDCKGLYIPDYAVVNTEREFTEAYNRMKKEHGKLVVKFVKDEGAMSYRRIADCAGGFRDLKIYPGPVTTYEAYVSALREVPRFDDLMIMPYLSGTEISVDCLDTAYGLIAVPRYKGVSREEKIIFNDEIINMSRIITDKLKLQYPCNIQFKMKDGKPYLLEINARMSGGLQMTCLSQNINIPNIALNKVLGRDIKWSMSHEGSVVSYIETPKIIRRLE